MDFLTAAEAADKLLDAYSPGIVVDRDPFMVLQDDAVFVFARVPAPFDDQMLVVEKSTGEASLVLAPPWEPHPYPDLVPLEDES